MDNFLNIRNLTAGYGNGFHVRGIDVSLAKGSFTGIVGPNGSGKTTLFKAVSGELGIKQGSVRLNGQDLARMKLKDKARKLAVVSMETDVAQIPVEDYVLMGRYPHHKPFQLLESEKDRNVAQHYIHLTGIDHLRDRPLMHLSGGEKQLAGIARALTQQPELLMLDEPTSHLDIRHQVIILDLLQHLHESTGISILMIIHDLNLASGYCDQLLMMKNGILQMHGTPEQVLTVKNIEDVYETPVVTKRHPLSGKPVVMLVSQNHKTNTEKERFSLQADMDVHHC